MIGDLTAQLPSLTLAAEIPPAYYIAPVAAIIALIMAFVLSQKVMKSSEGDEHMIEIAEAVRQGAMAYLKRQYKVVFIVFLCIIVILGIISAGLHLQPKMSMIGVPIAGLFSGLCGWFGMKMATNASARTTHAAKQSLNAGLVVAFRSGAVMGLVVVGFALLDASAWFFIFNRFTDWSLPDITTVMLSYGMGASTQALFARVGGGIYTKAADVGADLVGKVEAGIPEDDPRNPATIADNVGDNVGDVAGMGADLYESYYGSILATMALGAAAAAGVVSRATDAGDIDAVTMGVKLAAAPLVLAGIGILLSLVGIFSVKAKEGASFAQLLKGLHKGVHIASGLIVVLGIAVLYWLFHGTPINPWGVWGSIIAGLSAGLIIAHATEYYTSYEYAPTRRISESALTGPATVIIGGIAEGMKSTWASLATIIIAIIAAFSFSGGGDYFLMGLYGVGIAAVGMLSTLGITLATDAYGPIADNAGGNAEMTGQPPEVRERTDMLDSLGNTTAATGKGFAIGSAALTALALFAAYVQVVQVQITRQAEQFLPDSAQVEPMTATYTGYGKFALVLPGEDGNKLVDGGMWMNYDKLSHDARESVAVNMNMPITPLAEETDLAADKVSDWVAHIETDGKPVTLHITAARNSALRDILNFYNVTLMNPLVLGGLFAGVLLAFLFCALTMDAVGRAANKMMVEARRQFALMREGFRKEGMKEEDIATPTKWPHKIVVDGHTYPDYANCVAISTGAAQKEMIIPASLAIIVPLIIGLVLGVPGVMGMLAGGLTSGFALAIFMANAGGAWDNAKKLIESQGKTTAQELVDGKGGSIPEKIKDDLMLRATELVSRGLGDTPIYGKGSEDHKATVVGDTVGDPFKDTSGPSLNILIKLISIVSVVFAGLIVKFGPVIGSMIGLN